MNAQRWAIINSLYHAALAKEPGERSAYLVAVCAEDPTLRSEIESLLGYADAQLTSPIEASKMSELLDKIGGTAPSDGVEPVGPASGGIPPTQPTAIGRYRILRLLGEGGMGVVYEAEQEQPRRTVALKVIKPGLISRELLRRFEQESQALGQLQHPGIAQIHEAGTADTGFGPQPYFAMEFIQGESLLEYAKAHELNTRQRLELMAKVCEAVHHAHQRGIIHRDLKPANIVVDESGQPKVLDFGVARVTDSDTQATRQTDLGRLVGTLAYMSPEQALADPLEVDTRSDVYALGVILYELLAGRLPYTISCNLPEAVQTIRGEDPARLSSISRTYRGDIETIVAKALEKDKGRRYGSAADLAGDIRRYLADEPIIARPPSTTYQLQKFARRHKALVAGIGAVFVVLIAGIIASTWEATRARRAEQKATSEAATASAVNDFLQNDLLGQASANNQARPDTKPDPDLKVRTALDRAAAHIKGKFKEQPLVEASIRHTIADSYRDLGLYSAAQEQIERCLDLRRRVLGEAHRDTLDPMNYLAGLYWYRGLFGQAEALYTKVLELRRRLLGEQHPDTLDTMHGLAVVYRDEGKYAQAEPLFIKTLEVRRHVQGEEALETIGTMFELAELYRNRGEYENAERLYTKNLEVRRRAQGEEHPDTLATMNNLAGLYRDQGKYAQAEPLYIKALESERRVLGEEHDHTLNVMNNLALLYVYQGRYSQAEPLFIKILEVRRRTQGDEHPNTLAGRNNLALLYLRQNKYAQAEPIYKEVLELQRRVLGGEHPRRLATMNDLALLYLKEGRYEQSAVLLREALEFQEKTKSNTWVQYNCQSLLGATFAGQRKYAQAEPLLLSGYQGMLQRQAMIPAANRFNIDQAGKWIIQLYHDWGKLDKAAEWREKLHVPSSTAGVSINDATK